MTSVSAPRRKICFFVRQLDGGGAQKIMLKLANATAESGHDLEVHLVTLQSKGMFDRIVRDKVHVHQLPARRLLTASRAFARFIKENKPDVVIATEVVPNIIAVSAVLLSGRRDQTRLIVREALYPSIAMKSSPHRATRLGYRIARFFYPRADAVIAIAHDMVDDLSRLAHVPKDRIVPININPCVDDRVLALSNEAAPHPWLADTTIPCAVAVGRLADQKGFDVAVAAVAQVARHRSIRMLIVGDGPLRDQLQAQITALGAADYIQLAGKTPNPYAFMAHATMFLMPSRYEGLGNVLIEALACGSPPIAANCLVGPRETLADGAYGELFPVDDVDALAAAIQTVLDNPPDRERLRRRGLDFTAEASLRHYLPVLLGEA
ncbi:glycosyltransferase [Sphingobium amiense]|uniref:Glycosyltransferase n=1 Tax=Sphingobium amiense TaxID=135719 RepID=A0A494WFD4_9SPHN|nr:glycosyltransferase [Sphingobium amiense]BBD99730.1 glycosyltransferase [Sphingobium amiense]